MNYKLTTTMVSLLLLITLMIGCRDVQNSLNRLEPTLCYKYKGDSNDVNVHKICLNSIKGTALLNDRIVKNYKIVGDVFTIDMENVFMGNASFEFTNDRCFRYIDDTNSVYCVLR